MVGRETRMRWLPARQWYVAVHGLLQDTTSQEVIGNYLEERKIRVRAARPREVVFDFRRKAAPIEVQLYLDDSAAGAAGARGRARRARLAALREGRQHHRVPPARASTRC